MNARFQVKRRVYLQDATVSSVWFDDKFLCYALEDTVRESHGDDGKWYWDPDMKQYGKTAVPSGIYPIVIDFSPKYQRPMPHVLHVPDFTGIRWHNGGTVEHTEGCGLPGEKWHPIGTTGAYLTGSKAKAFPAFRKALELALKQDEDVYIRYINEVPLAFK